MARVRASKHPRGARAPRVGISAGSRRFDSPARVAFLHAANDNRSTSRTRLFRIVAVTACGVAMIAVLLAI
ncbi:MAG: hypothetical protein P1U65_02495 [Minwuia sp.]|nr:hypothetical protein [Minwuia sp.]